MSETTGRQTKDSDDWLDFKAIKEKADARAVLSHFGLLEHLEVRGAELVGWCPLGEEHGKKDSFSMNVEKKNFQCFACKARGSVLDFVAKFQNSDVRKAAHTVLSLIDGGEREERAASIRMGTVKRTTKGEADRERLSGRCSTQCRLFHSHPRLKRAGELQGIQKERY